MARAMTLLLRRSLFTQVQVHSSVQQALRAGRPVVALESTIISHGLPFPQNLEMAREVEQIVRDAGAVPATCAIINGFPKVGLEDSELEMLADISKRTILKASRRDVAFACATRQLAATTVASTMMLASAAGVRVFATGGIGGVHRGGERSMDISADLHELANTPVTVVCSGVKVNRMNVNISLFVVSSQCSLF